MNRRTLAALLFLLSATAQAFATTYTRYEWALDETGYDSSNTAYATCQSVPGDSACPAAPGAAMTAINSAAPVSYAQFGRVGRSAQVTPSNGGYRINVAQNNSSSYGFAWMAFVWVDQSSSVMQSVLWAEGVDPQTQTSKAGFSVTIGTTGVVTASIGHNGVWAHYLSSINKVGLKAWHHVALVWDTQTYYLLLDGVLQGSVADAAPPDEALQVPIAVGAFYSGGNPRYLLNGSIDEVKFMKFTPGSFSTSGDAPAPGAAGNFVLNEAGLELRKIVFSDLIAKGILVAGNVDLFTTPTFAATSTLRAYVNSFYNMTMTQQPVETFPGLSSAAVETYVFPLTGVDPQGYSPPSPNYSLFMRMRAPTTNGYCESAALTLWGVYKAFGYAARKYDWMSGPNDFQYTDSHSLVEVFTQDTSLGLSQYVMQDPTFNISGRDNSTSPTLYRNVTDLYPLQVQPPASMPFNNNGYNYNPSPIWTITSPLNYFFYFNSPTAILNSWSS